MNTAELVQTSNHIVSLLNYLFTFWPRASQAVLEKTFSSSSSWDFHFASIRIVSFCIISFRIVSDRILSDHIMSERIRSDHIMSFYIIPLSTGTVSKIWKVSLDHQQRLSVQTVSLDRQFRLSVQTVSSDCHLKLSVQNVSSTVNFDYLFNLLGQTASTVCQTAPLSISSDS